MAIERFQLRGQNLCNFMGTKEIAYITKEFNSFGLEHQHGRRSLFWDTNKAALSCENAL